MVHTPFPCTAIGNLHPAQQSPLLPVPAPMSASDALCARLCGRPCRLVPATCTLLLLAVSSPLPRHALRGSQLVARCSPLRCLGPDDASTDVGSVVGGLHGGKYQFGAGGATSYTGREFAESLAACGNAGGDGSKSAAARLDRSSWPRWAQSFDTDGADELSGVLLFDGEGACVARVANVYRTWEPFYAAIIEPGGGSGAACSSSLNVSPTSGTLAPRGGANNVCDPSVRSPPSN